MKKSALNGTYTSIFNVGKQKHDSRFVYIVMNCKCCISRAPQQMTLKFLQIIRNTLREHCKHLKRKSKT